MRIDTAASDSREAYWRRSSGGGTKRDYLLGGSDASCTEVVRAVCRLSGRRPPRRRMIEKAD